MKAGCFDGLPGHRAQQLAVLETAIKVGARARKDRAQGQVALFGAVREADPEKRMQANLPDVPPLGQQELAQQEKEALGLYVRFDPLVEHRRKLTRFCTAFTDELAALPEGEEVVMGGMVEKVNRRTTRNKDAMAVLKVLDVKNTFEAVLFPRAFEKYGPMVEAGTGALPRRQARPRARHLAAGGGGHPLRGGAAAGEGRDDPRALRGGRRPALGAPWRTSSSATAAACPSTIDIVSERFRIRSQAGNGTRARASDELADEVERLLGPQSVTFDVRYSVPGRMASAGGGAGGAMRILGIDPGTQVCGYGVIETRGADARAARLRRGQGPRRLAARPAEGSLRRPAGGHGAPPAGRGGRGGCLLPEGRARGHQDRGGARRWRCWRRPQQGIEVVEYAPAEVKKAVTGNGNASKPQVQQMVRIILRLAELPSPEDAADALAIAVCHFHRLPFGAG